MTRNRSDNHDTAGVEARRWPRSIRFLEGEWKRIEAFADARGLTGPEFVRFATLAAIEDGGDPVARLAPLIKMTFRGTRNACRRGRARSPAIASLGFRRRRLRSRPFAAASAMLCLGTIAGDRPNCAILRLPKWSGNLRAGKCRHYSTGHSGPMTSSRSSTGWR